MATVTSPEQLAARLAQTLDFHFHSRDPFPAQNPLNFLHDKELLLIV